MHTYIQTYVHTYLYIYIHTCVHKYMDTHKKHTHILDVSQPGAKSSFVSIRWYYNLLWRYSNWKTTFISRKYCSYLKTQFCIPVIILVSVLLDKRVAVRQIAHISWQRVLWCYTCHTAYSSYQWQERIADRSSGQRGIMKALGSVVRTRRLRWSDKFQARRS